MAFCAGGGKIIGGYGMMIGLNLNSVLPVAELPSTPPVRLASSRIFPATTSSDPANNLRNILFVTVPFSTCKYGTQVSKINLTKNNKKIKLFNLVIKFKIN